MSNKHHLLLWTDQPNRYVEAIRDAGLDSHVAVAAIGRREMPSEQQMQETTALLAAHVPAGVLARMPRLRWAQSMTAGVEGWLSQPDLPPDLVLTCARGTHRESMPENILATLFHIRKPFTAIVEDQKHGRWGQHVAQPLNGTTLGILGLGAIGQDVARLASALGMHVIGTKRRPEPIAGVAEVLPPDATEDVLARSDFVLLLLPATPHTTNFINAERLSHMRHSAWLLNFGRGAIIDDEALIAAVESKQIAGAVLDVFRQEPLPAEHRFWTTKGIVVLPHIGGPHPDRDRFVARLFVENLGRFLADQPLQQVVDRSAGY